MSGYFIALLRGINVSGQKMIKMVDLRESLAELPFNNIQTYIQSGNIVFKADEKQTDKIESLIKNKIREKYGFDVPTLVRTPEELSRALRDNPFQKKLRLIPREFISHSCQKHRSMSAWQL